MATIGGPNTEKDGLVFGYDTGYRVASNSTTTRFYPGEPTTNQADTDAKRNWGTHNGAASSTTTAPEKGPGWKKLTITNIYGSNYRLAQFPYLSQADGTSRTYSVEFDVTGLTGYFLFVDGSSGYSQTSISGRGRYSFTTGVISGNKSLAIFIGKSGTHSSINDVIYYKEYQVEVKGHATPFTATSRSSTQSLIDLKRTTDIDLSNVSFDSTGQPEFDGTNDYINIPSSFRSYFTSAPVAVELVLKKSSADQAAMVVFDVDITRWNLNYNLYTANQWAFDFYDGTEHVISAGNYDNEYVHFVLQQLSNGTMEIYANGILKGTITSSGNLAPNSSGPRIGSRSNGDSRYFKGELPVFKIFSKSLTVEEIKQNYNAYKNRFDI